MRSQRSPVSSASKSPSRAGLKSPKAPWVPAPAKTTRGSRVTFEVRVIIVEHFEVARLNGFFLDWHSIWFKIGQLINVKFN